MMEPHMIENYIFIVFVIEVNHVGFRTNFTSIKMDITRISDPAINLF